LARRIRTGRCCPCINRRAERRAKPYFLQLECDTWLSLPLALRA
jgi:hypothetical protein